MSNPSPDPDFTDGDPGTFSVTMLMADSAQVANRKLYILGGGISGLPAPGPLGSRACVIFFFLHFRVLPKGRYDLIPGFMCIEDSILCF